MNISNSLLNWYRKLKQVLDASNVALENKGFNHVNSLSEIIPEIEKHGEINCLPYLFKREIVEVTENDLADVTTLRNHAFLACTNLKSITIPDSVISIGDRAFYGCTNLKSITIPDSVISIGDRAFYNCTSLESITIPFVGAGGSTNPYLGYLFGASEYSENEDYLPKSLKEVIISNECTSIAAYAFAYCRYLQSVIIGNNVSFIGSGAFSHCNNLVDIYLYSTTPPILNHLSAIDDHIIIHVPVGSGDTYKSATNWSYRSAKIVEDIEISE